MQTFRACSAFVLLGGFLLAGAATAAGEPAAVDLSKAQTVQVGMADFDFTPKKLQFHANLPYRLRLTNRAGHGHSFDAPEFFAAAGIAPDDWSKVVGGEIEV